MVWIEEETGWRKYRAPFCQSDCYGGPSSVRFVFSGIGSSNDGAGARCAPGPRAVVFRFDFRSRCSNLLRMSMALSQSLIWDFLTWIGPILTWIGPSITLSGQIDLIING